MMKLNRRGLMGLAGLLILSAFAAGCNNTSAPDAATTPGKTGAAATPAAAGGGNGNPQTGDTIKVGAYLSLTGSQADFGKQTRTGILMAVDKINAAGGINGKKIEAVIENDEGDAGKTANAVTKLVSQDKVVAVLGEIASSLSLRAAPICQNAKVPMVTPSSTNVTVTEQGDYIFRVCFIDSFQAYVQAKFIAETLKLKKAALMLDSQSAYSQGLGKEFKDQFTKMGGQIVSEASYSPSDTDFKGPLSTVKTSTPDIIYLPGYYTDAGKIATQARELGMAMPFMGGDGWDVPALFTSAGTSLEGSYFSDHIALDRPTPALTAFQKEFEGFKAKPGNADASFGALTTLGYDAMMIVSEAMKKSKTMDGIALHEALAGTKDYPAVTGKITLDEKRNAKKAAVVVKIVGKEFKWQADVLPQ